MTLDRETLQVIRRAMARHDSMTPAAREYTATFGGRAGETTDGRALFEVPDAELRALVAAERRRWGKSYHPAHRRVRHPLRPPAKPFDGEL